jgi:hypothetical protein
MNCTALAAVPILALMLAIPHEASAMGLGTTGYLVGRDFDFGVDTGVLTFARFGGWWLPSFDLYPSQTIVIQIHGLDTLAWLFDDTDQIYLGGDISFSAYRTNALPGMTGVIEPGGSLDLWDFNRDLEIVIGGQCRFGIEGGEGMRMGVYLVPGIGVATGDFNDDVVWAGNLQWSMWFGS